MSGGQRQGEEEDEQAQFFRRHFETSLSVVTDAVVFTALLLLFFGRVLLTGAPAAKRLQIVPPRKVVFYNSVLFIWFCSTS